MVTSTQFRISISFAKKGKTSLKLIYVSLFIIQGQLQTARVVDVKVNQTREVQVISSTTVHFSMLWKVSCF
ncbi:unnamed protein product [Allacma fusca]|uniref:Uncharacterized protein n=1 Tax=Allacma fusca TaxID=39272 RepID=A0A8J2J8I4_9HEXA|nr:unnamed protein product [Allacma fusca]